MSKNNKKGIKINHPKDILLDPQTIRLKGIANEIVELLKEKDVSVQEVGSIIRLVDQSAGKIIQDYLNGKKLKDIAK